MNTTTKTWAVVTYVKGQRWIIATFATQEEALKVSYGYRINGTETLVERL